MLKIMGKRSNGELLALCPMCKGKTVEGRATLSVNCRKLAVYCFRCGHKNHLTKEDISTIIKNSRMDITTNRYLSDKPTPKRDYGDLIPLTDDDNHRIAVRVREYAKSRGLYCNMYEMFYNKNLPWHLIFKVDDSWQGRVVRPEMTPKNMFPQGMSPSVMYFHYGGPSCDEIVICEGIMDAIATRNNGRISIALMGSIMKKGQLPRLANLIRGRNNCRVIVMLDSDAKEKALKIALQLRNKTSAREVRMVDWGKNEGDPDSITQQLREHLIDQSILLP